ncbi:hypothetical protein H696_00989 [Fonticula alba]|uniref:Uncharacterized protein n=1 Tax=Fonticula alba TaxID=691883 RepID=A0A058ZGF2_FONAL|nr:hypothetical protein H696_00989 [Fonticula alba]KCV73455.1 hypothetical protein H696_00989 [Fonticula alba]|eukprot:XP_009493156.1 hypothetical protein H696_00989 [Fonticula alba]
MKPALSWIRPSTGQQVLLSSAWSIGGRLASLVSRSAVRPEDGSRAEPPLDLDHLAALSSLDLGAMLRADRDSLPALESAADLRRHFEDRIRQDIAQIRQWTKSAQAAAEELPPEVGHQALVDRLLRHDVARALPFDLLEDPAVWTGSGKTGDASPSELPGLPSRRTGLHVDPVEHAALSAGRYVLASLPVATAGAGSFGDEEDEG